MALVRPVAATDVAAVAAIYAHHVRTGTAAGTFELDPSTQADLAARTAEVQAEAAGVRKVVAVIGESANAGSIGVQRAAGFVAVGTLRSMGWKFGRWRDIVLMEKPLGMGGTTDPE